MATTFTPSLITLAFQISSTHVLVNVHKNRATGQYFNYYFDRDTCEPLRSEPETFDIQDDALVAAHAFMGQVRHQKEMEVPCVCSM